MQELKTSDVRDVIEFVERNAEKLEMAELSIRRSAGIYIADVRPTDEPIA